MSQLTYYMTVILIAGLTACNQEQADSKTSGASVGKTDIAAPLPASKKITEPVASVVPVLASASRFVEDEQDAARLKREEVRLKRELDKKEERKLKKEAKDNKVHLGEKQRETPLRLPMTEAEKQVLFEKRAKNEADLQAVARKSILSDDKTVRQDVVLDLKPEDAEDLKLLLNALNSDPDPEVRVKIARRLGFNDYPLAVPSLIQSLQDKDSEVVLAAIESLSWYVDEEKSAVINALQTLQNHPDSSIRNLAQKKLSGLIDTDD